MSAMVSQITGVSIVYSTGCSGPDQRKHPSSASLAFVRGIHRETVDSPHKGPVMRKMCPFNDVILLNCTHFYFECTGIPRQYNMQYKNHEGNCILSAFMANIFIHSVASRQKRNYLPYEESTWYLLTVPELRSLAILITPQTSNRGDYMMSPLLHARCVVIPTTAHRVSEIIYSRNASSRLVVVPAFGWPRE